MLNKIPDFQFTCSDGGFYLDASFVHWKWCGSWANGRYMTEFNHGSLANGSLCGCLGVGSWMEIGAGKIRSVYWNWHHWTWIKLTTEMGLKKKKKKQAKGRGSKIQTYRKTKLELKVQMIWKDIKKKTRKG